MTAKLILISVTGMAIMVIIGADVYGLTIASKEVDITITDSYVSRYIWRGQDLYADNDGAHQASIDIAFAGILDGLDVSLNAWGSFPLSGGHEDAEELDYTLTFSKTVGENLSVDLGYTYFDFPNASSITDVSEPWINLGLLLAWEVSFDAFAGYDFQAKSGGPDEGWYYSWGFSKEVPLGESILFQDGQTLSISIMNWGNDGVADLKPSALYATKISLSTSYQLGDITITPSFHYATNYESEINSGDDEIYSGIEASYAF